MSSSPFYNEPAPGIPYFTPNQTIPAGTAITDDPQSLPKLFQPLTVRGLTFQNRIWLSPLCQYSSKGGIVSQWQLAHLGGIFTRGPGLTFVEATAVVPEGRITPEDAGIWSDEHVAAWKNITTFAHSQGQKMGIQLSHAGRKASTVAPWLSFNATATEELDGWPESVYGPSAIQHSDGFPHPKELTKEGIDKVRTAFIDGAKRAIEAGFDVIELHAAHGYLLHQFVSPASNTRTDEYGGSFENRVRLVLEIVEGIRAVIPESMPFFVRISATDRLEETLAGQPSWTVEESIKLTHLLAERGVDVLDVTSAGNHPLQKLPPRGKAAFHADLSAAIKAAVGDKIIVASVGGINSGKIAQEILDKNEADACLVGRPFLKNPFAVWAYAEELGVTITAPNQISWAFFGRGTSKHKSK